jgi:hypothetical protein
VYISGAYLDLKGMTMGPILRTENHKDSHYPLRDLLLGVGDEMIKWVIEPDGLTDAERQ